MAQKTRVAFLTLRNRTGSEEAEAYFGGERDRLRAGDCVLATRPLAAMEFVADNVPFYVPDEIVDLVAIEEVPLPAFWRRLEGSVKGRHPVLYVHGFYISFERGCKRAALFQDNLDLGGRLVLFSWPSDGVIVNYPQDEADMYWSVMPLKAILAGMARRFGRNRVDLVAHSLGTRGLMLALAGLAQGRAGKGTLFDQLVLIAPDIDAGIFRQYLPLIRPLVERITLYVSDNDSPLALSRQVHGQPRLGEAGDHLDGLQGVEIVDVSDIPVRYISGHLYHLYHETVVHDLDQLLNENKPASQRHDLKKVADHYWKLKAND